MRLDKLLSEMGKATRSECGKLCRSGKILVNGKGVKSGSIHINPETDVISLNGSIITYKKFTYIMLNKPEGYVSATDDPKEKTVLDLIDEEDRRKGLFPCGRLDKNTLGLVILFKCLSPLSEENRVLLEKGIDIGGYVTKPCQITLSDEYNGEIILTEGKYHQIKRMLEAVDNKITYLERVRFGSICLDSSLSRGEWRYLTDDEEKLFSE